MDDFAKQTVQQRPIAGGGRICFRGDTRSPKEIFKNGFFTRTDSGSPPPVNAPIRLHAQTFESIPIHPEHLSAYKTAGFATDKAPYEAVRFPFTRDVDSLTAVCVTPRFSMAALFPPKRGGDGNKPSPTWIYAVYVRSVYNTHAQQVCDGLKAVEDELDIRRQIYRSDKDSRSHRSNLDQYAQSKALWPLYAQELATSVVQPEDVLYAVKCDRHWRGDDWKEGADFTLDKKSIRMNSRSGASSEINESVKTFLDNEPEDGTTPSRSSGFYKQPADERISIDLEDTGGDFGIRSDPRFKALMES